MVGPAAAAFADEASYCSVALQDFGGLRYLLVLVAIVCFVVDFSSGLRNGGVARAQLVLVHRKRVPANDGVGNSSVVTDTVWSCATPDGDVYPHILACPPITAVLLFDQTGQRRMVNAAGRVFVDRSVWQILESVFAGIRTLF